MSEEKKKKPTTTKKKSAEKKKEAKPNSGQFKKGNTVGKETRFTKDHTLSCKYKPEYCDKIIEYFSNVEREVIYEEFYFPDGTLKGKKPVQILPPKLPTMEGFAESIGVINNTLLNWCKDYPQFENAYARAKQIQKDIIMTNGAQKQYDSNFSKFLLMNNHGMAEQVKNDTTFKVVMDDAIDEESN